MNTQATTTRSGGDTQRSSTLGKMRECATHPIETAPISTTLLVFGAGLGLGALIGSVIAEATSAPPTRRAQAEELGHSVLAALSSAVPDSVRKRLPR